MSERVTAEVTVILGDGHDRYELAAAIGRALNTLLADGVILSGYGYSVGTSAAEPLNIGLGERL